MYIILHFYASSIAVAILQLKKKIKMKLMQL